MKASYLRDSAFARLESRLPQLRSIFRQRFGVRFARVSLVHTKELDQRGADLFVHLTDGSCFAVDVKVARRDPTIVNGRPQLPLEIMSCVERQTASYLLSGGRITRYLLWIYPTAKWVLLPFRALAAVMRRNVESWSRKFRVQRLETQGKWESYHSTCMFIPLGVVEEAIRTYLAKYRRGFAANA